MNINNQIEKARSDYYYALNNKASQEKINYLLIQYGNLLKCKENISYSINTLHSPRSGFSSNTSSNIGGYCWGSI